VQIKSIHVELTNKCYLKCERCSRTTFINSMGIEKWKNVDINLSNLQNFIDIDLVGITVILCGNYGDPIYYPHFIDTIKWIKENKGRVKIETNASYQDREFWQTVTALLNEEDIVIFSIDGIPENFTKYRKNGDWSSISLALSEVGQSNIHSIWKYIPFSFNEHTIADAKKLAASYGITEFWLTPSDRFFDNDWLKPKDNYVNDKYQSIVHWKDKKADLLDIDPKCHSGNEHYISADGYYLPCCYVGDWRFYYKTKWYQQRGTYNISKTTLSQIIKQEQDFFQNIVIDKPDYCTYNCPKI